jgi:hypothetical protein
MRKTYILVGDKFVLRGHKPLTSVTTMCRPTLSRISQWLTAQ